MVMIAPDAARLADVKDVVLTWLRALGRGEDKEVIPRTAQLFSFRTTSKTKKCEQDFAGAGGVLTFMRCLQTKKPFIIEQLGSGAPFGEVSGDTTRISAEVLALLPPRVEGEFVVGTYLNGNGVSLELALVLRRQEDRSLVRALASAVYFETG